MKARPFVLPLFFATFLFFLLNLSTAPSAAANQPALLSTQHAEAPLLFIENIGQFDQRALFQLRGDNGTLWLAKEAVWLTLLTSTTATANDLSDQERVESSLGTNLKLSFVGSNPAPQVEPFDRLETSVNYFIGANRNQWQTSVPVWRGVRYRNLYPGIDFEFVGETGQPVIRLICHENCPSAIQQIRLQVEGSDALRLTEGYLTMNTVAGDLSLPPLSAIVTEGAAATSLHLTAHLEGNVLSFTPSYAEGLAPLALTLPDSLTGLQYGTFLGGNSEDGGGNVMVDQLGNAYVTGVTYSANFPTTPGTFDPTHNGGSDGFVVKLNPTGSNLVYATFLGGTDLDVCSSAAVNETGNVYVTGYTTSTDFPTTPGAYDPILDGYQDSFILKLNPDGDDLVYATFLGGDALDQSYDIALDATGTSYIVGTTTSTDFPATSGVFDPTYNGDLDTFIAKLNPTGSSLAYATYLGSDGFDLGNSIALDTAGDAYVAGFTNSTNFPTTPTAYDPSFNGSYDVFVVKLNTSGSNLNYATFLGGSSFEGDGSVAVDEMGNAYVLGLTNSPDFPITTGAFDTTYNGNNDAFVAKLNASGTALTYATFLGGVGEDSGTRIAVDTMGSVYGVGNTSSGDFPTTPGAFSPIYNGVRDAYIVRLNPEGSVLTYGTFLGGVNEDFGNHLAVTDMWLVSVTGSTISPDFPTTPGAYDPTHNSGGITDAFVVQLALPPFADFSGLPTSGTMPLAVTFTNLSSGNFTDCYWHFGDGATSTACDDPAHSYAAAGVYTVTLNVQGPGGTAVTTKAGYIVVTAHELFLPFMVRP